MGFVIIFLVLLFMVGIAAVIYYFTQKQEGESVGEMVKRIKDSGYKYVTDVPSPKEEVPPGDSSPAV
jgi:Na+-transporting methylmalonyl-CoA/oxaloacetate decarboxylase gamma subunit